MLLGIGIWLLLASARITAAKKTDVFDQTDGRIGVRWSTSSGLKFEGTPDVSPSVLPGLGDQHVWYKPDRPSEIVAVSPVCPTLAYGMMAVFVAIPLLSGYCIAILRTPRCAL